MKTLPTEKILNSGEIAEILKEMEEFLSAPDTFTTTITRHEPITLSKHFADIKNKKYNNNRKELKMDATIYSQIYNKLISLIPNLEKMEVANSQISKANGFMDLHLDILSEGIIEQRQVKVISLAHYYEQNGDLVPDPDMTIKIYSQYKIAEALTLQDYFGYQQVYPTQDTVNSAVKVSLNSFLKTWLNNCIRQGHQFGRNEIN
ncbi:hypothetical protein GAMM_90020 [Gammaproteobacteria bacterium]